MRLVPQLKPQTSNPPPRPPRGTSAIAGANGPEGPNLPELIYCEARRSGLTDAEARNVLQETLASVARHIAAFNPIINSHKARVLTLTRWRIVDQFRKRGKKRAR